MSREPLMTLVASEVDDARLQGLGMYVALRGMSDAGHTHSQVANELFGRLDSELFATFDADELVAYTSQRPRVTFLGDHFAGYQTPRLEIYLMTDELDRKFWLLTGVEPDLKWDRLVAELLGFIEAFNINLVVSTASLPCAVTPTGRVVGYSLHTPHYLAESEYPAVAVAALEHVGAALKLALPTDNLREAGRLIDTQLAEQLESSTDVRQMVDGFEQRFDAHAHEHERRSLLLDEGEDMPDAEELGTRVEDFLANIEDTQDWLNNSENGPFPGESEQ